MKFRTEYEAVAGKLSISHSDKIIMLGSCFTDNVGAELERDGFDVMYNPMGPLYNPASLCAAISRYAGASVAYDKSDLVKGSDGKWHCLDFASAYADEDAERLLAKLASDIDRVSQFFAQASVAIITFGTSMVWKRADNGASVGNCHKFPDSYFKRQRMTLSEISSSIDIISSLLDGKRVIFTVSPVRYVGDGLHANQLNKASLLLGIDHSTASDGRPLDYFPAYEIVNDDLRDYRFYAADMKHPSDVAVQYIYEKFKQTYFDKATVDECKRCRDAFLRSAHRPNA